MTDAYVTVEMILKRKYNYSKKPPAVLRLCLPEHKRTGFGKIRTWLMESNSQMAEILQAV